jgi:hypothetical protein
MRRFVPLLFCALFVATTPAFAQRILPHSFSGWNAANTPPSSSTSGLAGTSAPVSQAVLGEYGWAASESLYYASGANPNSNFTAIIYKMKDPSGGYGLYSYLCTSDMNRADFSEHSSASNNRAVILIGNLVLDIEGYDPTKDQAAVKSLVAAVAPHAEDGPLPTLWQYLPHDNMIPRSNRYILGPQALNQFFPGRFGASLGFEVGAEAELAHYRANGHDATLLVVDLPTPQLAQKKLEELQKSFGVNEASEPAPVFAKRSHTLLVLTSGFATEADAKSLLNEVSSSGELTWDEPTFQFKEPSIEAMVVGAIVGSGLICLFALVAGLSFGGLRLFTKRFFPGKLFDTKGHLEVLQLGLASKPINPEDFYAYSASPPKEGFIEKNLPDRIALRIFR